MSNTLRIDANRSGTTPAPYADPVQSSAYFFRALSLVAAIGLSACSARPTNHVILQESHATGDSVEIGLSYADWLAGHVLKVANRSPTTVCVKSIDLQPSSWSMSIFFTRNRSAVVGPRVFIEPGDHVVRNVDLSSPWFMIAPGDSHVFPFYLGDIGVAPGKYDYEVVLPIYRCGRLVSALDGTAAPADLESVLKLSGRITIQ